MPSLKKSLFRLTLCFEWPVNFVKSSTVIINNWKPAAYWIHSTNGLKGHPEIWVSHSIEHGEAINGNIADKFYKFYRNKKANQVFGLVLWHWLAAIDPFLLFTIAKS